ncbi:hypothetical protein PLESTM_001732400 [Pleodorina starrii]|nr:hypothetical protein PLESTM_001732400 [Pleodorina starrii]
MFRDSLQLIHDGAHTASFPVPLRHNTTGAPSNSSSAVVLSAPWPMTWKFWLEGYPNWVLNLTHDLTDAYVQVNLLLDSEFTAMYDGSCSAWAEQRLLEMLCDAFLRLYASRLYGTCNLGVTFPPL